MERPGIRHRHQQQQAVNIVRGEPPCAMGDLMEPRPGRVEATSISAIQCDNRRPVAKEFSETCRKLLWPSPRVWSSHSSPEMVGLLEGPSIGCRSVNGKGRGAANR